MKEITVVMRYVPNFLQWYMFNSSTGGHLQEFMDCENIRKYFEGLEENGRNYYKITIEKVERPTNEKTINHG